MTGRKLIIYLLELNKPIRLNSLFFYLNSKFEDDRINEMKETYLVDLISVIAKSITRNKNIKQWSDFEKKLITDNRDKRTAKEIEEDVLNKFKSLKGRG